MTPDAFIRHTLPLLDWQRAELLARGKDPDMLTSRAAHQHGNDRAWLDPSA